MPDYLAMDSRELDARRNDPMGWRMERSNRWAILHTLAAALIVALVVLSVTALQGGPQGDDKPAKGNDGTPSSKVEAKKGAPVKPGLLINDPRAFQGYNLMGPLASSRTYLFDMHGRVVRTWDSDCSPALCPHLLDNGHVLRGGSIGAEAQVFGPGPGVGGRVQEFTWEGELVWDFRFFNARQLPHHDLTPLPNGNVMMIVWDRKTTKEALAAGRRAELTGDSHLLADSLVEIKPTGKTTGEVVWEWHLWDHLVQDFDKTKVNYGNVAEHPELVNINYGEDALAPIAATKDGSEKLKSVGYIGANTPAGRPGRANADWTHFNAVAYNPELDQLMVSTPHFSEFWIIDHSTTTAEAARHEGGRSGKGGDLLYRWGNPRAYRAGKKDDQKLFAQHNAHWIPKSLPGEGHVLVFNNGSQRPDGSYSSVDEIILPVDPQGRYTYKPGSAYGPEQPVWSYVASKKTDFYSFFISGAQRLPNGNTFICSGADGTIFEVTPEKEIVWKYVNPVKAGGMPGPGGFGPPPQPGQVMTPIVRDLLAVSSEQRNQLDEIQKDVEAHLDKLLTAEQKRQLKAPPETPSPGGFGSFFRTGQLLTSSEQNRLKLSEEQKNELAALQKDVDGKLEKVLNEDQRKQSKGGFAFGGPPPGAGGPGAPSRPGQLLPSFLRDALNLSDDQKKQLDAFQKEAEDKFDKLLTEEQKKQFKDPQNIGSLPQPGQLMSLLLQVRLKLTPDQKKTIQALQKEADALLGKLFTDEQKKQFKEMQANVGRGGPRGPGGPGGPPGGPGMPNLASAVFRVYRFAPNHPGLAGKDLTPGKTIEEMQPERKEPLTKGAQTNGPGTKEAQKK
jgi:Arylsulfotransferase (ASST)